MPEEKRTMVTSLRVDPDLWREAKIEAVRHDMTLGDIVEEALKCWMDEHREKEKGGHQK